jgi:hypothetical protein
MRYDNIVIVRRTAKPPGKIKIKGASKNEKK